MENGKIVEVNSLAALRKRCPICGDLMHQEDIDGVLCWVCNTPAPDCGYIEPIA